MGQKVNPIGLRLGIIRSWDSTWYAKRNNVAKLVHEDRIIRDFLIKKYRDGALAKVELSRGTNAKGEKVIKVNLHTAKPGMVIGRDGALKKEVVEQLKKLMKTDIQLSIIEVKLGERNAQIIADSMARKLEARASFRRVQKLAIQRALKLGAKGIKTLISGRLGGTEIARGEGYNEGQVPLHTLRMDIDYATSEALTKYGILGIKVWVNQGEVLKGQSREENYKKEEEKYSQGQKSFSKDGKKRPPLRGNAPTKGSEKAVEKASAKCKKEGAGNVKSKAN